ncbi:hypothetical protein ACHAWF_014322 [Thalassiosira exigua]
MKLPSYEALFAATTFQLGLANLQGSPKSNPGFEIEASSPPSSQYTFFIKTRNHDVLDRVLQDAPRHKTSYLSKAQVRDISGLHHDDIKTIEASVKGLGGDLLHVSAHADSVTIEVPRNVSREDVTRTLKASSSAVSLRSDKTESSIHDHIALIHQHRRISEGASLPKKGADKASPIRDRNDPELDRNTRRLDLFSSPGVVELGSGCGPFTTKEIMNNIGLYFVPCFIVLCPNGEPESKDNKCSSSATLKATPHYPLSGNSDSPEHDQVVEIEDIETLRGGELDEFVYFYNLPLRYFKSNVLYDDVRVNVTTTDGQLLQSEPLLPRMNIVNAFNATGASIKELSGVPKEYQGTGDQVQITSGAATGGGYYYDAQSLSSYLENQGITDFNPLEIVDTWYPPYSTNNQSMTNDSPVLDVSALQSFAPKATTKAVSGGLPQSDENVKDSIVAWDKYFGLLMEEENFSIVSFSWSDNTLIEALYNNSADHPDMSQGTRWANAIEVAEDKLKKLAARGFTILVASGDQGSAGAGGGAGSCINETYAETYAENNPSSFQQTANGLNVGYLYGNQLLWPTFSPYVTSVGGSQLLVLEEDGEAVEVACSSETGCTDAASSGGFSGSAPALEAVYKRPIWQDEHVEEYLKKNGPEAFAAFPDKFAVGYNPGGRAIPDLASYANKFPIQSADFTGPVTGTSLAAPSTAGLITLVNQALLEKGYDPVGYLNPMLYWMGRKCPQALNDITFGNNQADSSATKCQYGFNAARGWDVRAFCFLPFFS